MMCQLFDNQIFMSKNIFFFASALLLLAACNDEKKCKFKPEPIFENGLPHIQAYNYEREGNQSLESLLTDRGVLIEVLQDICTETRQEYRFTVEGNFQSMPDSLWLREAPRQFVYLSGLSPKQEGLKAWADVIESNRDAFKLGQELEVQQGIFVKVDKVLGPDKATLLVTFYQP